MFTGAIIGGGLWVTLALFDLKGNDEQLKIDVTQTLLRAGIVIGVFAFWGWVVEALI